MFSPNLFLFLLPLIFFTLLPHGVSQVLQSQVQQSSDKIHSSGVINGDDHRRGIERILLETVGDDNSSLILADKRTRRKDPSNDFKYYTGGWNISDPHYIFVSLNFIFAYKFKPEF
ncbi:putative transmembrane protein [Helianthus anomalus]